MERRKKKKSEPWRFLLKTVIYAVLLLTGEILFGAGGYFCIMTHLPDAVGIPLMTAGFFLIVVLSCSMQEEYDRMMSAKYSGRAIYRTERKKEETGEDQKAADHGLYGDPGQKSLGF